MSYSEDVLSLSDIPVSERLLTARPGAAYLNTGTWTAGGQVSGEGEHAMFEKKRCEERIPLASCEVTDLMPLKR